jgi:hypothetical protein
MCYNACDYSRAPPRSVSDSQKNMAGRSKHSGEREIIKNQQMSIPQKLKNAIEQASGGGRGSGLQASNDKDSVWSKWQKQGERDWISSGEKGGTCEALQQACSAPSSKTRVEAEKEMQACIDAHSRASHRGACLGGPGWNAGDLLKLNTDLVQRTEMLPDESHHAFGSYEAEHDYFTSHQAWVFGLPGDNGSNLNWSS